MLLAAKDPDGSVQERLYLLPPDALAERWTGVRVRPVEAEAVSGISDARSIQAFERDFSALASGGKYEKIYLDLYRYTPEQPDRPPHRLLRRIQKDFAYLSIGNAEDILRSLRLIKQPCEIEALRKAEAILNDVGAQYDCMITDVSRAWPCNGKFSERQRILYECVLATSNYLFSIIRPGMKMEDVDATIRRYNAERLVEAGVLKSVDEVGRLMWHGGSHHIGYDVHDMVKRPEILAPNMVFCVDVGVYNEEWGIGFRLEDNCLVTEDGCENLSAAIPRTIEDIEAAMRGDV